MNCPTRGKKETHGLKELILLFKKVASKQILICEGMVSAKKRKQPCGARRRRGDVSDHVAHEKGDGFHSCVERQGVGDPGPRSIVM